MIKARPVAYEATHQMIEDFLQGKDSMERVIKIELPYDDKQATVYYKNEKGERKVKKLDFYPFCWAKYEVGSRLKFNDGPEIDFKATQAERNKRRIGIEILATADSKGNVSPRMKDGYTLIFHATAPMSFSDFQKFFEDGGLPLYPKEKDQNHGERLYMVINPVEQFMIHSKTRQFKGYDDYDDLMRLTFDLETTGLNPEECRITKIGIRINHVTPKIKEQNCFNGNERIITVQPNDADELNCINTFLAIIDIVNPDVITAHNGENFDWNFIDVRLQVLAPGHTLGSYTVKNNNSKWPNQNKSTTPRPFFRNVEIYKSKKEKVLKLGGEMEWYKPTVMTGCHITDSLHAVRRAQALDSSMKKADLKYVTKYSKLNKPNRVYVPGKHIGTIGADPSDYALNESNGEWFKLSDEKANETFIDENGVVQQRYLKINNPQYLPTIIDAKERVGYKWTNGAGIINKYLSDDLYECDKVEHRYNMSNFLVAKMLPVCYTKVTTMGTAAIWKYLMMAWSYEHKLAIPSLINRRKFTGGLSRLLKVGFVRDVVKLDYNSLYPSILLTFNIQSPVDIMRTMLAMLEYVLTQREHYKELKGQFGKITKQLKKQFEKTSFLTPQDKEKAEQEIRLNETKTSLNDKLQLPLKITANAYFGSFGSGSVFPWSDMDCAEETTCTGRMMLRLMISHFNNLSYTPVVGDSFTGDTPLFVKYKSNGLIDIKTISEIFDSKHYKIDGLGREYDYQIKDYYVLSKNGWVDVDYVYRHKTDKPIYRVTDGDMLVDVTEDHSLYDDNGVKLRPQQLNGSKLLYYEKNDIFNDFNTISNIDITNHIEVLNATIDEKKRALTNAEWLQGNDKKTLAIKMFISNCITKL